ncbi:unnamed protein product [Parascedosporium putredinis]|uniref:Uncharacterized protein n=1 Tax=Parascedosporium putredinis TaxID=1442378 RepID=A0A9P1HBX2_9PEZI|nr:unnamed protein product [Parascedosporium putredinis]CAI8003770.1 unnamed protein product [Parascedosporium putredinis]
MDPPHAVARGAERPDGAAREHAVATGLAVSRGASGRYGTAAEPGHHAQGPEDDGLDRDDQGSRQEDGGVDVGHARHNDDDDGDDYGCYQGGRRASASASASRDGQLGRRDLDDVDDDDAAGGGRSPLAVKRNVQLGRRTAGARGVGDKVRRKTVRKISSWVQCGSSDDELLF